jgi:hypothetical protein
MAKLTSRALASGATLDDLIHIVITGDTSQDPAGSSYKATLQQVLDLYTGITEPSYTAVTITSAQTLTLFSSPVEILPDPGVNNYYDAKFIAEYHHGTTSYTGRTLTITDNSGSNVYPLMAFGPVVILTGDTVAISDSTTTGAGFIPNSPLYVKMLQFDPVGGDGEIIIKIWYTIRTMG